MKDFPLDEIARTERFLKSRKIDRVKQEVGGRNLEWYVLPQAMNSDLPDFIFRVTNSNSIKYVIGVSDSVPAELRPYFALSEYIEFIEKGIDTPNRVIQAEKETLNFVPRNLWREYVERKLCMLEKVVDLSVKKPDRYLFSNADISELERDIWFLRAVYKGLLLDKNKTCEGQIDRHRAFINGVYSMYHPDDVVAERK